MPVHCRGWALIAACVLLWPLGAAAEPYGGLFVGGAFSQRNDVEQDLFAGTFEDVDFDKSVVFGGKAGYFFDPPVPGFQATAGTKFFLIPHLALFGEYKFVRTADFDFKLISNPGTRLANTTIEIRQLQFHLATHILEAGLAYHW